MKKFLYITLLFSTFLIAKSDPWYIKFTIGVGEPTYSGSYGTTYNAFISSSLGENFKTASDVELGLHFSLNNFILGYEFSSLNAIFVDSGNLSGGINYHQMHALDLAYFFGKEQSGIFLDTSIGYASLLQLDMANNYTSETIESGLGYSIGVGYRFDSFFIQYEFVQHLLDTYSFTANTGKIGWYI